jgi:hypothetical protein
MDALTLNLRCAQVGPVASIRVCRDAVTRRSLGYAYVNYNSNLDGALSSQPSPLSWSDERFGWTRVNSTTQPCGGVSASREERQIGPSTASNRNCTGDCDEGVLLLGPDGGSRIGRVVRADAYGMADRHVDQPGGHSRRSSTGGVLSGESRVCLQSMRRTAHWRRSTTLRSTASPFASCGATVTRPRARVVWETCSSRTWRRASRTRSCVTPSLPSVPFSPARYVRPPRPLLWHLPRDGVELRSSRCTQASAMWLPVWLSWARYRTASRPPCRRARVCVRASQGDRACELHPHILGEARPTSKPQAARNASGEVLRKTSSGICRCHHTGAHVCCADGGATLPHTQVATDGGKSKGYGFVHFETEEASSKAVEAVNGMLLNGKKVYVGPFLKKGERPSDEKEPK